MTEGQRNDLKKKNKEYAELCEIVENYDKFMYLYTLHFCKKLENGSYEFSEERAERNATFMQGWNEKQTKLENRIAKDKYFVRNGRIGDEKELRYGRRRFAELTTYCKLEKEFAELEARLVDISQSPESDLKFYIDELRSRKEAIENEEIVKNAKKQKI